MEANHEDEPKVSQGLSDEIDGAVNDTMHAIEAERAEREQNSELSPGEKKPGEENGPKGGQSPKEGSEETHEDKANDDGKSGEQAPADAVTDDLLERAVRAGVPMAEAKKYSSASMLEFLCAKLEDRGKDAPAGYGGDDEGKGKKSEADSDPELQNLLEELPDLDPDEYDEKIVKGFKAMKDIIRKQHEAMKASGAKDELSWFDSKVSGLGEAYSKELAKAPETRAALKEQFDVLTAGYKAAGKDVDQETIFNQAAAIALRDVSARVADADKAEGLRKRASQHIQRPNNSAVSPSDDVFNEIAAEVDRKYFGKK